MKITTKKLLIVLSLLMPLVLLTGCPNGTVISWANSAEYPTLASRAIYNTAALNNDFADATIYSTATLDDDFEGDTILLVLTRSASRNFTTLTPMDFPELELSEVTCLTPGLEQAQAQIAASLSGRASSLYYGSDWSLDINQFRQIFKLRLANPCRENVLDAIRVLERREDIRSAEPNFNFLADYTFENSFCLDMFELFTTDTTLWNLNAINVGQAHAITSGASTVRVGLLSTGVDVTHPDLGGGKLYPVTPRGANQPTGSQNFRPSCALSPLTDPNGHGTHIAGTIMGRTVGVAPNSRLVSLKVATGTLGTSSYNVYAIIAAIQYAGQIDPVRGGIRIPILNLSLNSTNAHPSIEQAILNYMGLFIMGVGNQAREIRRPFDFNALRGSRIITVGATSMLGSSEQRWESSNWSNTNVCVFAPGHNILSTVPLAVHTSGFRYWHGTSVATPHVAATAALMLFVNPTLTPAQIRMAIINTADRLPNLAANLSVAGGRINAYRALRAIVPITTVNIPAIQGVLAPVVGATPIRTITAANQYTGTVTWSPNHAIFSPGTQYTATIRLTARQGFTFNGVWANFFTVAGAESTSNPANSGVITAVFPMTDTLPVSIPTIQGLPAPVVGATPVRAITATNQYTGTVTWSPNHAVFRPDTQYTATITLTARAGYTFHGVAANFFTAAGATVLNAANSGVVTAVFPMTPPPSRLFGGGSGTSCDPYLIFNEAHLRRIYLYPNRSFELVDNIDLSQGLWSARFFVHNWTPIPEFHGTFEGNGLTISGLSTAGICVAGFNDYSHLLGGAHHFGLFTGRNFGTIRNLNVHAKSWLVYEFHDSSPSNHDLYVGVIAGANFGTIENCNTHCDSASMIYLVSMNVSSHARATRVGGIAGYNAGTIIGSNNYGGIFINTQNPNDANLMNGIFGRNSGTVRNSRNYGSYSWGRRR